MRLHMAIRYSISSQTFARSSESTASMAVIMGIFSSANVAGRGANKWSYL